MKDLLESVRLYLYDRLRSPFFGAFVAAWICWNYRFLLIVFSGIPLHHKFFLIEAVVFPDSLAIIGRGFFLPLLSSIFVVLAYPVPARLLYKYWATQEQKLKEERVAIEKETIITRAEAQEIYVRLAKATTEREEALTIRSKEIDALKDENARLNKSVPVPEFHQLNSYIDEAWKAREPIVQNLFKEGVAAASSRESFEKWIQATWRGLLAGKHVSAPPPATWDFTIFAMTLGGAIIWHPGFAPGAIPVDVMAQRVRDVRTGSFVRFGSNTSEQLRTAFHQYDKIFTSNSRLTRVWCQEIPSLGAILAFESHVNIIHHVLRVDGMGKQE